MRRVSYKKIKRKEKFERIYISGLTGKDREDCFDSAAERRAYYRWLNEKREDAEILADKPVPEKEKPRPSKQRKRAREIKREKISDVPITFEKKVIKKVKKKTEEGEEKEEIQEVVEPQEVILTQSDFIKYVQKAYEDGAMDAKKREIRTGKKQPETKDGLPPVDPKRLLNVVKNGCIQFANESPQWAKLSLEIIKNEVPEYRDSATRTTIIDFQDIWRSLLKEVGEGVYDFKILKRSEDEDE